MHFADEVLNAKRFADERHVVGTGVTGLSVVWLALLVLMIVSLEERFDCWGAEMEIGRMEIYFLDVSQ